MNTADTIRAAIERLEQRRDAAKQAPWDIIGGGEYLTGVGVSIGAYEGTTAGNAELIVTLHRTIDAQLRLLRNAARAEAVGVDLELALACAILGTAE